MAEPFPAPRTRATLPVCEPPWNATACVAGKLCAVTPGWIPDLRRHAAQEEAVVAAAGEDRADKLAIRADGQRSGGSWVSLIAQCPAGIPEVGGD